MVGTKNPGCYREVAISGGSTVIVNCFTLSAEYILGDLMLHCRQRTLGDGRCVKFVGQTSFFCIHKLFYSLV